MSRRRLLPFGLDRRRRVTFSRTRTTEQPGVDGLPPRAGGQLALAHAVGGGRCADRLVNDPAVNLEGGGDQLADLLGFQKAQVL